MASAYVSELTLPPDAKASDGDESGRRPDECIERKHPSHNIEGVGNFDCSICLDSCQDPVVTMCGHLFCWSCLYSWLSLYSGSKECPVCKSNVHDKVIPLYGRGRVAASLPKTFPEVHIPCRPSATRSVHAATSDHHVDVARDHGRREPANHAARIGEVRRPTDAQHSRSAPSSAALLGCFASLLIKIGFRCPASHVPSHIENASYFQWHPQMSVVPSTDVVEQQQRRRANSEKEFVLHWAFIVVGLVAAVGILFCG